MKKFILLSFLAFSCVASLKAQTVIYSENWTSGGAGWSLNVVTGAEGADPNFFNVSANEGGGIAPGSCGVANNGNNTMHVTSVFNPTGGAAYDAGGLCGFLFCPQTNRRAESPTYNCTGNSTISVNFNYIEGGQGTTDDATLWYFNGATWAQIDNMPKTLTGCGGQGIWTARTVALPASANNNPNVKIGFRWVNNDDGVGNDPSFAVDDITLTVPAAAVPVATITPTTATTICAGGTVGLNGSATNGPITGWAWSSNPAAGVSFSPDAITQNVTATFTTAGTYTVTLTATNASGNGSTTQVITVNAPVTPSVAVTASPINPVCAGTAITFTATPTNGGAGPTYQWAVNATNVGGATSSTFTSSTLTNNDVVSVVVTSNATCISPATATNSYTVTITTPATPSVSVSASPVNPVCAGTAVTFTATPTNGGTVPTYQWAVNGSNVGGATSSTFTSSTLANNDQVTVIMTSNDPCVSPTGATSPGYTMTVTAPAVPAVSVSAGPVNPVCAGTSITFTATPTNGGTTPTYQWAVNGSNVGGATSSTFTSSTLIDNDQVTVIMTSNDPCVSPTGATSTAYTVSVSPTVIPSVTIAASPLNPVCSGTAVTFTATPANGGAAPAYQWLVNNAPVAGETNVNFTSSTLADNDVISVVMTSNDPCPSPSSDTSTVYTVNVLPLVIPSVTINASPSNPICAASAVTFTATPTNGGTAPAYQWLVNNTPVGGATGVNFTSSTLVNNDQVTVIMTSNDPCPLPADDTSNIYTIQVSAPVTPAVTVSALPVNPVCAGTSITFTANPTNGGSSPTYQWQVNGTPVAGATNATFTTATLSNNDLVSVVLTSNAGCVTTASATATDYTVTITPTTVPAVSASAAPAGAFCAGTSVTFTANPTNGGAIPAYQWAVNGSNVAGATNSTFTSTTLNNNDQVTVTMTSNDPCPSPSTATSTAVTVIVTPSVIPSVTIAASPVNPICAATAVTFTATPTNGGTTPTYQWQVNGSNVAGATGVNFSSSTLVNNDQVTVVMTSNAVCPSPATATATTYTIVVSAPLTPAVTVTAAPGSTICTGASVTFTANPTNGGTAPAYQWQVNGTNVGGATSSTFTSSTLNNNDQVTVTMTSNAGCVTTATANSSALGITVTPTPTLSVIQGSTTICPGSATLIVSSANATGFNWNPSTSLNTSANDTVIFTNASVGVYNYTVTPTNGSCNGTTQTITVTVSNTLAVSINGANTVCSGDSIQLTANGGSAWTWTPATNISCTSCQNPYVSPNSTVTYSVTATSGGCSANATQLVTVNQSPLAGFNGATTYTGTPATVSFANTSTNSTTYVWNYGDLSISADTNTTHIYTLPGTYIVSLVAQNLNGCPNDTVKV
ncbi:MAG: beta strand repeat-containing protein, partial [Bacteroidia bacterium]